MTQKKKVLQSRKSKNSSIMLMGIGMSAGGLAALEGLVQTLPNFGQIAYIVVQHLSPNQVSNLDVLLQRLTPLTVKQAVDQEIIRPDTIYILPTGKMVEVECNSIKLVDTVSNRNVRFMIDRFFTSLSMSFRDKAIGVLLSGTGSDGVKGLEEIKEQGGFVIVQDPREARYSQMPQNAIESGAYDEIAKVDKMISLVLEYLQHAFSEDSTRTTSIASTNPVIVERICKIIKAKTGYDFSQYKQSTIERRIARRLIATKHKSYSNYISYLKTHPSEVACLVNDFLITVTYFFRDPEAFTTIEKKVAPVLLKNYSEAKSLRVWIPACASGEEAYSIAIILLEAFQKIKNKSSIQIYATDLDDEAIAKARKGIYPENVSQQIPSKYLDKYFRKVDNRFHVKPEIRDIIVFAKQNIVSDPPFSKMDLICCRNLLIYMSAELQRKVIQTLHFALNPQGFLFLGPAESLQDFSEIFHAIENKWKIFQRTEVEKIPYKTVPIEYKAQTNTKLYMRENKPNKSVYKNIAEKTILENYSLPSILVDHNLDIQYFHGNTDLYLSNPKGNASFNVLNMLKSNILKTKLKVALQKVIASRSITEVEELNYSVNKTSYKLRITLKSIQLNDSTEAFILMVFDGRPEIVSKPKGKQGEELKNMERELNSYKESLQSTIEELEASNEELKSTNEELQSTNEELQSSNEELETSKEELQSTNEELATTNSELKTNIEELSRVHNDINNLLASTEIETIFLDSDLKIKRFTPAIKKIYNVKESDIDRPISDITSNINYNDITRDAKEVLDTLIRKEIELEANDGRWLSLRILPYRTVNNVIDGVVITFIDITELKVAEEFKQFKVLVNDSNDAVIIVDLKGNISLWNKGAESMYGYEAKEMIGSNYATVLEGSTKNKPSILIDAVQNKSKIKNHITTRKHKNGSEVKVSINLTLLNDENGNTIGISSTERDISSSSNQLIETV